MFLRNCRSSEGLGDGDACGVRVGVGENCAQAFAAARIVTKSIAQHDPHRLARKLETIASLNESLAALRVIRIIFFPTKTQNQSRSEPGGELQRTSTCRTMKGVSLLNRGRNY